MNMSSSGGVHLASAERISAREMRLRFGGRAVLSLASTCVCPKLCGMIYRCVVALFCLFSASSTFAQLLRVELEFEQETYLPREPLYAVVRIYNTSGRTLVLGQDNEWL